MPVNFRKTKTHYNDKYVYHCVQKMTKEGYSINQACKLLNISRQKYYNVRQRLSIPTHNQQTGGGSVSTSSHIFAKSTSSASSDGSVDANDELNTENMEEIRAKVAGILQTRVI